ncbi:MAG: ribosomal protein L18E [Polaribacter sp.]|jgi:ribosomal protein L18E
MYVRISILVVAIVLQACSSILSDEEWLIMISQENPNLVITEYQSIVRENNAKYIKLQAKNLEQIKNNQPALQYAQIERQLRNVIMDLLSKMSNNQKKTMLINPITVTDLETAPYEFEINTLISTIMTKEFTEFGVTVVDDSIFDSINEDLEKMLILDTQISKVHDYYTVNCFIRQANSSEIYAVAMSRLPSLLLEKSSDGVVMMDLE